MAHPFADLPDLITRENEPLAPYSTFRVGGPARYLLVPGTVDALAAALRRTREAGFPIFILGGGTNVLVADGGFDGVVIQIEHNLDRVDREGDHLRVSAGARLPALSGLATRIGLAGMEALAGIPGTVGGALGINAGAFGKEFGSLVVWAEGLTFEGEARRFQASEIQYAYRKAVYPEPIVFTGSLLRLAPDDPVAIAHRAGEIRTRRAATQPTRLRSAGCAFKNPLGISAGQSIDRAGLKGLRIGGAEVSTVHANYLVNAGGASADDIRRLMGEVQERVRKALGIQLEIEVRLLGFSG